MTLDVAGNVAGDAKPGDYTLEFVAIDENNTPTVSGNELIKVTIPVTIEAPKFADMFEKDANWNDAKDTYTARIFADGYAPTLRYVNAFKKAAAYADVETSHIGIVFNAIEHNQYPILNGTEYVTDNTQAMTTFIADGVELNKNVVYNDDQNALEVRELTGMRAYYDVFDGVTNVQMGGLGFSNTEANAVKQAFTAVSDPFTTQIKEALAEVAINYYINGTAQSVVKLNNDGTITPGSGTGDKRNGLRLELNGDVLDIKQGNFDGAAGSDLLEYYTLYSAFTPGMWAQKQNYEVSVLFEGANAGESVMWNTTNKNLQFNIAGGSSTLNVSLKDATGIEYKLSIKVEK